MSIVKIDPIHTDPDGALRVQLQDNTSYPVVYNMITPVSSVAFLTTPTINTNTVVLLPGHGAVAGQILMVREDGRVFQSTILNVATDTISLDTPLDYAFTKIARVTLSSNAMNIDGSSTPVIFSARPPYDMSWDIYGIAFLITDNVQMDSAMFGGITALPKGIVIRNKNSHFKSICNIKTNGQLSLIFKDFAYDEKAPSGVYGIRAKHYLHETNGTAMRLHDNDAIEIVIQDNLTGLSSFTAIAYGHEVT